MLGEINGRARKMKTSDYATYQTYAYGTVRVSNAELRTALTAYRAVTGRNSLAALSDLLNNRELFARYAS